MLFLPSESSSPSASARGGRSARSFTDTIAPTVLQTGSAVGATASQSFSELHSSASDVGKLTYRSFCGVAEQVRDGLAHEREHAPRPRVKEQRLLVDDEELVEGEAAGDERHRGADAEDPAGDLVDVGTGLGIGDGHLCPPLTDVRERRGALRKKPKIDEPTPHPCPGSRCLPHTSGLMRSVFLMLALGSVSTGCGSDVAAPARSIDGGSGGIGVPASGGAVGGTGGASGASAGSGGSGTGDNGTGGSPSGSGGSANVDDAGAPGNAGALPEGDHGIAAKHRGDVGIGTDPNVIFADDFPRPTPRTRKVRPPNKVRRRLSEPGRRHRDRPGERSRRKAGARVHSSSGNRGTPATARDRAPDDRSETRSSCVTSKFEPPFDVVASSHNGASISAHYFNGNTATPGVPADGTNKFLVRPGGTARAATRKRRRHPVSSTFHVYHPEQRSAYGDHFFPTGLVDPNTSIPFDFGPDFAPRPDVIPELGRWYCYEYMVQANTPGKQDGRIAIWLDGVLTADFGNPRFRDVGP